MAINNRETSTNTITKPALPPRLSAFVKHYKHSRNATEAAKFAGYSHKNAHNSGSRLLKNTAVLAVLEDEMEWDFDIWLNRIKSGAQRFKDIWQADKSYLELYGKARGWLRESSTADLALGLLERVASIIKEYNGSKPLTNMPNTIIYSQTQSAADSVSTASTPAQECQGNNLGETVGEGPLPGV